MLISDRRVVMPSIAASLETLALVHERFRVHLVRNQGVVCEDNLLLPSIARKGALGRSVATIVLEGRARIEHAGTTVWLQPGDLVVLPDKSTVGMRQEGDVFRSVAVEWDDGLLGSRPSAHGHLTLSPQALERVELQIDTIRKACEAPADGPAETSLVPLVETLRAEGLPLDIPAPGDLHTEVPTSHRRLSRILDEILSHLDGRPMAVDFNDGLAISARQVSRVVTSFNARYGFNAEGWRDTLLRRRLSVGSALMTADGAKVEDVAAALGYSSPSAMCRAFAQAGLPSPGEVRSIVRGLR